MDYTGWARSRLYKKNWFRLSGLILYALFFRISFREKIDGGEKAKIQIFFPEKLMSLPYVFEMKEELFRILSAYDCNLVFVGSRVAVGDFFRKFIYLSGSCISSYKSGNGLNFLFFALMARGVFDEKIISNYLRKNLAVVVTFCDAIGNENSIAQAAGRMGIFTATLQHGQYRFLGFDSASPDAEAYLNFVSDIMFCWGEETIREFEKAGVARSRFLITGRLSVRRENAQICGDDKNCFGVVLSGENQAAYNKKLVAFCNEYAAQRNMTYVVRLHPSNSPKKYLKMVNEFCVDLKGYASDEAYFSAVDFSIMGMTGVFLSCIECRHKFLFYNDGSLAETFIRSDLSVSELSDVDKVMGFFGDATVFESLKKKYNYDYDQERVIKELIQEVV